MRASLLAKATAATLLWVRAVSWASHARRPPQTALLKQVKGVGTLIAMTYMLTLEVVKVATWAAIWDCSQDGATRGGASRNCISAKRETPICERCWCRERSTSWGRSASTVTLRRWGLKLAERGGKSGKKRAIVATARKLAVLLHHLWVSGEAYEPLHNSSRTTVAAVA